jgi:hypothetical protein
MLAQELPQPARRLVNFRGNLGQGIELSAKSATPIFGFYRPMTPSVVHVLQAVQKGQLVVAGDAERFAFTDPLVCVITVKTRR